MKDLRIRPVAHLVRLMEHAAQEDPADIPRSRVEREA